MLLAVAIPPASRAADKPFLPPPPPTVSTIPFNGDVNPYGVAFVPDVLSQTSVLHAGDVLVSNFNNNQNLQGTGTTIMHVDGNGVPSLFFQSSYRGLSAALGILHDGTVIVGSLPTADGTSATAGPGALQIVSPSGVLLNAIANPAIVNGPWGLAVNEATSAVQIFISNVLNGTITRLTFQRGQSGLALAKATVIAAGLNHRPDPAALWNSDPPACSMTPPRTCCTWRHRPTMPSTNLPMRRL